MQRRTGAERIRGKEKTGEDIYVRVERSKGEEKQGEERSRRDKKIK